MRKIFYPNQNSREWLYSINRDHDFPRRVYSKKREAKICRSCGNKFVAAHGPARLCPVCAKQRQDRELNKNHEISERKEA